MSSVIEINSSEAVIPGSVAPGEAADVGVPTPLNAPPLCRRPQAGPAPLSLAQERLWFLDQINPGDASANLSRAVRIKGAIDKDVLQQALQAVVKRHEVLRTTFAMREHFANFDGQPMQLRAEEASVDLTIIELSENSAAGNVAWAEKVAREQAR